MSTYITANLTSHFEELKSQRDKLTKQVDAAEAEDRAFYSRFEEIKATIIEPALMEARDALLERNLPAAVVKDNGRAERKGDIIALHFSNDKTHLNVVAQDPMFRFGFEEFRKELVFFSSRSLEIPGKPESYKKKMPALGITRAQVDRLCVDAVKACIRMI